MKKQNLKRKLYKTWALLSALGIFTTSPAVSFLNSTPVAYAESMAVIAGSNVNVRSSAGTDSSIVTALGNNSQITVIDQTTGSDGNIWYHISFSGGSGYVRSDFVRYQTSYSSDVNFESYLSQQGFPESYKPALRQLHTKYPNWVFTAEQTGLDWSYVIQSELQGTNSLIEKTVRSSWKSTDPGKFDWATSTWPGFDGATWVAASQGILEYYMDPRNFLDEDYIFQFTAHKYDPNKQTLEGLKSMVQGTFLEGTVAVDSSSALYQSALQQMYANAGTVSADTAAKAVTGPTVADSVADLVNSGMSSDEVVIAYEGPASGTDSSASVSATVPATGAADTSAVSSAGSTYIVDATGTGTDASTGLLTGPTVGETSAAAVTDGTVTADLSAAAASGTTTDYAAAATNGTMNVTYSDIIMEAAQMSQVNPYVLASMIIQEQGTKGTSGSISGATGYYNFFNVGAYATGGMTAVERGIWYASQSGSYNRPWNSIERAIIGGALFYAQNYVDAGQNTLYLKKFNVQGSNMFKHQYMTNTQGAAEEGKKLGKAYNQSMRNDAIEFFIPVYSNMPETACVMPTGDGNPNNKLAALSVDGFTLTPGFNMDTESYTLIVDPSVSYVNVSAAAIHSGAAISGGGTVALTEASTIIPLTVTAENGDQRTYTITINKAAGGMLGTAQTAIPDSTMGVSVQVEAAFDSTSSGSDAAVSASSDAIASNVVEVGVGPL